MSTINISTDNVTKYNKRAHRELEKLVPNIKYTHSCEFLAKVLGFQNVHHLTKILETANLRDLYGTSIREQEDQQERFDEVVPKKTVIETEVQAHISKAIDGLFDVIRTLPYDNNRFSIVDDNRIDITVHKSHKIPLRFGKYGKIRYIDYSSVEDIVVSSKLSDPITNAILNIVDACRSVNFVTNDDASDVGYKKEAFNYFIESIIAYKKEYDLPKSNSHSTFYYYDQYENIYYMHLPLEDIKKGTYVATFKLEKAGLLPSLSTLAKYEEELHCSMVPISEFRTMDILTKLDVSSLDYEVYKHKLVSDLDWSVRQPTSDDQASPITARPDIANMEFIAPPKMLDIKFDVLDIREIDALDEYRKWLK